MILNILLGVAVIYAGVELHGAWVAAHTRQAKMPGPAPKAPPVAPVPPLPQQPAVLPSLYVKVATNDLFDASRNPDLPVVPPPPPPPPAVPPPLPGYHGFINFGDVQGPVALLTDATATEYQQIHAGETIGEFKLVSFDRKEMVLDWRGQNIHKRLNEGGGDQVRAQGPVGDPTMVIGVIPGAAQPAAPAPKPHTRELGPGVEMTDSVRACQQGDSNPAGTVNDGYRKEVNVSPMGAQCIWRAIGK